MASLNRFTGIGNVSADPEIRDANGAKVASFRIGITERYRDRNNEQHENTEWVNIVAWRNIADIVERFVKKGSSVYVEGKLATRQWTDQQGNKRFSTEVHADNIQLLGAKPNSGNNNGGGYTAGGYPRNESAF